MKLGILSDTHNNLDNTQLALELLAQRGVRRLLHCGDITSPSVINLFAGWRVSFVFGNMDYPHTELNATAQGLGFDVIRDIQTLRLAEVEIALCHGHRAAQLKELSTCGVYRYVFHGHTHRRRDEVINNTTRVVNPGALGGTYRQSRSICILDIETDQLEFIEIEEYKEKRMTGIPFCV